MNINTSPEIKTSKTLRKIEILNLENFQNTRNSGYGQFTPNSNYNVNSNENHESIADGYVHEQLSFRPKLLEVNKNDGGNENMTSVIINALNFNHNLIGTRRVTCSYTN